MKKLFTLVLPFLLFTPLFAQEVKDKKEIQDNKDSVYIVAEKHPEFPGGQGALLNYLNKTLRYPDEERDNNIQGLVIVSFVVRKDGSITDIKILKGATPNLDAEAMRVVKAMPAWIPGERDGEALNVGINLPIRLRYTRVIPKKGKGKKTKFSAFLS